MKIVISIWQNRVSPLFDSSHHLLFSHIKGGKVIKKDVLSVEGLSLFQRAELLQKLSVDILICGGITQPILDTIRNKNIKVIPFLCGDANDLLEALRKNRDVKTLFSMPGKSKQEIDR